MSASNIISLLGGIALFLFGMSLMGDGLKKVAGNSLELILYRLSGTPLKGLLLGTGVTAMIQSSSATSVMVVGFVNSGIMTLKQALSVILGAIIGTSVTGWIIALSEINSSGVVSLFSTANLSAVIAIIGIALRMFSKDKKKQYVGNILLGFAVLMYGMQAMSGSVTPLKDSPQFLSVITAFSNPVVSIIVGIVTAAILQSASAAVGILQALSTSGVINFSMAFPILLGISVGAAVPVLLSAIGAKTNGKRSAFGYLLTTLLSAVFAGLVFYGASIFINFSFKTVAMTPFTIAVLNTSFRAISCFLLLPFIGFIESLLIKFIHETESEKAANADFDRLDIRFLSHPSLAVEQARLTINSMADKARNALLMALNLLQEFSDEKYDEVYELEDMLDRYEDRIGTYLLKLNSHELDRIPNQLVSEYLHTISDFERISDHATNIADAAKEKFDKKISFSPEADKEISVLTEAIDEIVNNSIDNFISGNGTGQYSVEPLEERIDVLCDEFKLNHVERMQTGKCSMNVGFVFNDIITNLERVAAHCSNIAVAMIEISEDQYDMHGYVIDFKKFHSSEYERQYEEYSQKYKV